MQMLRSRHQVVLDNIRDNDELGVHYQTVMHLLLLFIFFFSVMLATLLILCLQEIEANEKRKGQLQDMIEEAITNNGNQTYLRILSQYRLLVNQSYFYIFLC